MKSRRYIEKANTLMTMSSQMVRATWPFLNPEVRAVVGRNPDVLVVELPMDVLGVVDPVKSGLVWRLSYNRTSPEYVGEARSGIMFGPFHRYSVGHVGIEVVANSLLEILRLRIQAARLGSRGMTNELGEIFHDGISRLGKVSNHLRESDSNSLVGRLAMTRSVELTTLSAVSFPDFADFGPSDPDA